jgi:putative copper resistance protein D
MGYLAVGLILLTGCLNSWFMVDGIDALFSTTYGRVLIVKVGLFVLMVCVALFNRFALTPELLKPKAKTLMTETAFARLWRNVAIEQLLGLSIIAAVCVLGTLPPAMAGDTG